VSAISVAGMKWVEKEHQAAGAIACSACRHASGVGFEGLAPAEIDRMTRFKAGHDFARAGAWLGSQNAPFLFTLYSGWALRCREFEPGRRRAVGLALPGDLVGLETVTGIASDLRVRALTDVTMCRFDPARWQELMQVPSFAERVARIEAIGRAEAEDRLLVAGRSATATVAHFLSWLHEALGRRKLVRDNTFGLSLTLTTLAELLGLTPVHLRRILHRLAKDGIATVREHRVYVHDPGALRMLAGPMPKRPALKPLL